VRVAARSISTERHAQVPLRVQGTVFPVTPTADLRLYVIVKPGMNGLNDVLVFACVDLCRDDGPAVGSRGRVGGTGSRKL
jgi:hypothetical protein